MKGKLITYENNRTSLECRGEMKVRHDGVIVNIFLKGYPRQYKDDWAFYYQDFKVGDKINQDTINKILDYNGKENVVSKFLSE